MELRLKAAVMKQIGGASVIAYGDWPDPKVHPGWVLVEVAVAGVNFRDTGVRRGAFWNEMQFPQILGIEGAGRVLEVGEGVSAFSPGQRVAWAQGRASYAQRVALPQSALVTIPDEVDDRTAAAVMTHGLAANYLTQNFYRVEPGEVAFVHAAAGGLGQMLTQLIKMNGGVVIGRVSSAAKQQVARDAGVDHIVVDGGADFLREVMHYSDGTGVHVVYDGSGPATFASSIETLRPSGTLCWYGDALGFPPAFDIAGLRDGVKIGRAGIPDYTRTPKLYQIVARRLFDWVCSKRVKVTIAREYHLSDAARAHAEIESRTTMGKLLLIP
jgi:NADPH2:quinone reductase